MAHACSAKETNTQQPISSRIKGKRSSLSCGVSLLVLLLCGVAPVHAGDLVINNQITNAATGTYDNVIVGDTGNGTLQLTDSSAQTLTINNQMVFGRTAGGSGSLIVGNGSNLSLKFNNLNGPQRSIMSAGPGGGTIEVGTGGNLSIVGGAVNTHAALDSLTFNVYGQGSKMSVDNYSTYFNNSSIVISDSASAEFLGTTTGLNESSIISNNSNIFVAGTLRVDSGNSSIHLSGPNARMDVRGGVTVLSGAKLSGLLEKGAKYVGFSDTGDTTSVSFSDLTIRDSGSSMTGARLSADNLLLDNGAYLETASPSIKNAVIDNGSTFVSTTIGNSGGGSLTVSNGGAAIVGAGTSFEIWTGSGDYTINVGAAANEAAKAAGIIQASIGGGRGLYGAGTMHVVFNHTDSNYIFQTLINDVPNINNKRPPNVDVNVISGRTIFALDQRYHKGTTIGTNGILQLGVGGTSGSIIGDVINDGVLAFDRSDRVDFDGRISGGGRIEQMGGDTLHLNGDSSAFTGVTSIDNGSTLMVDGTLGGNILPVVDGNQLGGAGTILGDVNIGSGGILLARSEQVLNIGGNLVLDNNSLTNATLGWPSNVGTVHVAGDLTLGGTLNVESMNGDFGAGTYRIFDYDGTLTNNGYVLGNTAGGDPAAMAIQTSVDHQVNLINLTGTPLAFWDGGDVANHGNGKIDGGDGVWTRAVNANWTGDQGLINGGWTDGAFAVFNGKAGVVTVDASSGDIIADGMQFAVDGYKVTGDAITLAGNNTPVIRVQDKASAIIESELRGTIGLKKTDYGTLILAADNSYSGGTTVNEGTLQLGNGGNSGSIKGDVVLARTEFDTGRLAFNRSDVYDFNGNISGEGTVIQRGAGTTVLSGDNSFLGGLVVESGTARAGSNTAFGAGRLSVNTGGAADLNDIAMTLASITNAGTIRFGTSAGNTLTVSGDYRGNNGALVMNTVFGGDNSKSDRLVVAGDTAGTTTLKFVNQGGAGALTDKGIRVIEVGGNSLGAFELAGDFVTSDGQQAVIGGAYAYTLHHNGLDTPDDGDWYLRSRSGSNGGGDGPIYNPGVPIYTDGPIVINNINQGGFGGIGTRTHGDGVNGADSTDGGKSDGLFRNHYVWGRTEGSFGSFKPSGDLTGSNFDSRDWRMQAGVDGVFNETRSGTFMGSVWLDYVNSQADVSSSAGDGRINVNGYGFGTGLTWFGDNGFYVDGEGKFTWYRSKYDSDTLNRRVADGVDNFGYAFSLEGGRKISLDERWSVTPQAQLIWSSVRSNNYTDVFGSDISTPVNNVLKARLGSAVDYSSRWTGADGSATRLTVGGIVNLYQQLNSTADTINVSGVELATGKIDKTWGELGLTTNYSWMNDKYSVYGKITTAASLSNISDNYAITGNAGFRMKW